MFSTLQQWCIHSNNQRSQIFTHVMLPKKWPSLSWTATAKQSIFWTTIWHFDEFNLKATTCLTKCNSIRGSLYSVHWSSSQPQSVALSASWILDRSSTSPVDCPACYQLQSAYYSAAFQYKSKNRIAVYTVHIFHVYSRNTVRIKPNNEPWLCRIIAYLTAYFTLWTFLAQIDSFNFRVKLAFDTTLYMWCESIQSKLRFYLFIFKVILWCVYIYMNTKTPKSLAFGK